MARSRTHPLGAAIALFALACGSSAVPDPRLTAQEYAVAVGAGDAARVHALLDAETRRALGLSGVQRALSDGKAELAAVGRSAAAPDAEVAATASVRYVDGERAELRLEPAGFRVTTASGLPSSARTPEAALEGLRGALSRRSYGSLLRALTASTRSALDQDLKSLVEGLAEPASLGIRVQGDHAEVDVPGGHRVTLKREAGVWLVHDFD